MHGNRNNPLEAFNELEGADNEVKEPKTQDAGYLIGVTELFMGMWEHNKRTCINENQSFTQVLFLLK